MKSNNPWYSKPRGGFQASSGSGRRPNFPDFGESNSPKGQSGNQGKTGGRVGGKFISPTKAMEESEKDLRAKPTRKVRSIDRENLSKVKG